MQEYKIVKVQFNEPHPCQWMEGYHAVISNKDESINLCEVKQNGQPWLFPDGRFMINTTGKNNKAIHETDYILQEENGVFSVRQKRSFHQKV